MSNPNHFVPPKEITYQDSNFSLVLGPNRGRGSHEKDHVHFKDGSAINSDGSWKHRVENYQDKSRRQGP